MCHKSDIWLHILKNSNKISNEIELENENIEIYITDDKIHKKRKLFSMNLMLCRT